jgi:hypothetical protein
VFSPQRNHVARPTLSCFPPIERSLAAQLQCCDMQAQPQRKTAMDSFIGFAEITGAIIAALGLALGLEWVGLYGLTSLIPVRRDHSRDGRQL